MAISNPIISGQLSTFSKSYSYEELGESDQFEKYSIFSVLNGKEGLNIVNDDFHLPGTEFGLDGLGLIVNGDVTDSETDFDVFKKISSSQLIFFQSKTSSSLDYGDFSKFFDGIIDFIKNEMKDPTEDLLARKGTFDRFLGAAGRFSKNPDITAYYIYTGNGEISGKIQSLIQDRVKSIESLTLFEKIEINVVSAAELQKYYRKASESSEATFYFLNKTTLPDFNPVAEAYIGFIPATELLKIISQSDDSDRINRKLFFDNVRDYDPSSDVNLSIDKSLKEDPSGFIFRNNGITIVARSGRPTGNNFKIEDFQIVNGCQTSNIIFNNKDNIEEVQVPLRLIISNENSFINSIIVGTNRQNPVKDEQFWALKPFAKDLEEYVRSQESPHDLYFERRENQFRFDEVNERTRIVDSSTVVKSVVSMFLNLPNRAGRDYRQIKNEFGEKLFLDDHNVKLYHLAAYSFYRLEFLYRTKRIDISLKKYRMYILWAVSNTINNTENIMEWKEKTLVNTVMNC